MPSDHPPHHSPNLQEAITSADANEEVEKARAEAQDVQAIDWAARRTGLPTEGIAGFAEAAIARLKAAGEALTKRGSAAVVKS